MPEVGVFESPEMNAFATGARRNSALVAVSTGLLNGMEEKEAEAVLGHEITHVANGDMVTLTLIQGVVNTFVIFLARVIGNFVDRAVFRNENGRGIAIATVIAEIVLGLFASMIVAWFSRRREFRADAGGAHRRYEHTDRRLERLKLEQRRQPAGCLRRWRRSAFPLAYRTASRLFQPSVLDEASPRCKPRSLADRRQCGSKTRRPSLGLRVFLQIPRAQARIRHVPLADPRQRIEPTQVRGQRGRCDRASRASRALRPRFPTPLFRPNSPGRSAGQHRRSRAGHPHLL
jgi:Zn-dependent protease with chaperone function